MRMGSRLADWGRDGGWLCDDKTSHQVIAMHALLAGTLMSRWPSCSVSRTTPLPARRAASQLLLSVLNFAGLDADSWSRPARQLVAQPTQVCLGWLAWPVPR